MQYHTVSGLESETEYYFAIRTADENFNWSSMSNVVSRITTVDVCNGMTGNVDCDPEDRVSLADLVALAAYLFGNSSPDCICMSEANIDGSPGGTVNVVDLSVLIRYLFNSGDHPAWCL